MASNVISDLTDEFLVCRVCLEDFKQPKMLPCLHTFCQPCLEKLLATEPVGRLDCPTCRQDVTLPQSGVQGLKSNFLVGKLRDILQQQPKGKTSEAREDGVPCTVCEVGNSAQFYCVTTCTVQANVVLGNGGARLQLVRTAGEGGSGDGQFSAPTSLAVTSDGDIVVSDRFNSRLQFLGKDGSFKRKVDLGFWPWCVAALTNGELLVTGDGHRIHVLDKQGRESRAIHVTGAAETCKTTQGVAADGLGRIIVTIGHQFGDRGQGQQQLCSNLYVTVNSSQQIIVSDWDNHKIKIFDPAGRHLFTCGSFGSGPGRLYGPRCVITDSEDNIIVADNVNHRVSLFSRDGTFIRHVLTREEHGLYYPMGLTMTHDGHLVVSECFSKSINFFHVA
ncbi:tripartite motif-containing protein 3-like [Branchiostoma lanceolatum]|uniref:tripartite motif-containing protein 3-like n=1 Tax=Branchiostoma lanceolatum TaxID=7740 RepID=UPI0034518EC1